LLTFLVSRIFPLCHICPPSSILRPLSSVFCHLSSVIRHPSSVICPLSSVIRHPSSVLRLPSSVFSLLLFRIRRYICFHLIGIGETVGAVEHIHYGDQFGDGLIVQPEPLHGGTVGVDSVGAVVGNGHRQGDDLLGQDIELAGFHHRFQFMPGGLQVIRIVGRSRYAAEKKLK